MVKVDVQTAGYQERSWLPSFRQLLERIRARRDRTQIPCTGYAAYFGPERSETSRSGPLRNCRAWAIVPAGPFLKMSQDRLLARLSVGVWSCCAAASGDRALRSNCPMG